MQRWNDWDVDIPQSFPLNTFTFQLYVPEPAANHSNPLVQLVLFNSSVMFFPPGRVNATSPPPFVIPQFSPISAVHENVTGGTNDEDDDGDDAGEMGDADGG